MASMSETVDVESLQKKGAPRYRWLDSCLVLSVIVLFACLAAFAVIGVKVVRELQLHPQRPEFEMSKVTGSSPEHTFKAQSFAYLEASSSELKNQTMEWKSVTFRRQTSVGRNYEFSDVQHSLRVKEAGSYFLYLELNFTCVTRSCQAGALRIQVSDKLSCDVHLPQSHSPQQRKCWTVATMNANTSLISKMSLPNGPLHHWKLELRGSGLGMFLVG